MAAPHERRRIGLDRCYLGGSERSFAPSAVIRKVIAQDVAQALVVLGTAQQQAHGVL
jgi:hypothetical protein